MDYSKRLTKLQNLLDHHDCDAFIVENKTDLFYLTGLHLSKGTLLVDRKGATLLVDGRYIEESEAKSPFPTFLSSKTSLESLLLKKTAASWKRIGFDRMHTSYDTFVSLVQMIKRANKQRKNPLQLPTLPSLVEECRRVKDEEEIALLEKAAKLGSQGFDFILKELKEGISEKALTESLLTFWRGFGAQFAFDPIIAFGEATSKPHYRSGETLLKKGDPVLIDIGVSLDNYNSDMTRTLFFGTPKNRVLEEIYHIVKQAQEEALKIAKPGTLIGDLDDKARSFIEKKGYGEQFNHGLGHGLGLLVHESPSIGAKSPDRDLPLEEGMVITIEPGIYLPKVGGVRIEDTILITKTSHKNLTNRDKTLLVV
jgi:Xaa-Pro aminopeptidase